MNPDAVVNISFVSSKTFHGPNAASDVSPLSQRDTHATHIAERLGVEVAPPQPDQRETTSNEAVELKSNFHELPVDCWPAQPSQGYPAASPATAAQPGQVHPPAPTAPLPVQECAFCGSIGTPRTCGSLTPVTLGSRQALVHHACALWAADVYQPEVGSPAATALTPYCL